MSRPDAIVDDVARWAIESGRATADDVKAWRAEVATRSAGFHSDEEACLSLRDLVRARKALHDRLLAVWDGPEDRP